MTNIRTILQRAARDLNISGSPSPRLDAELLLMHFLKIDRLQLCTHPERELTEEEAAAFVERVERRSLGEPVAYIIGEKEFWSLRFEVGREVLIPRPETECLIEELLRFYRPPGEGLRILDIGTGSGAIGVVLARELPAARVAATDISAGALSVARRNALAHGVADRMDFFKGIFWRRFPEILISSVPTRLIFRMFSTASCRRGSGISSPAGRSSPARTAWTFTGGSSGKGCIA